MVAFHQISPSDNRYRVLMIGLDGATFDFISPWVTDGSLPTFHRLMEEGVYGPLISTIPSVTPPAWTSMVTGTNPGKHGVFFFHDLHALPEKSLLVNVTYRRVPAIWDVLTGAGKRSVILNLPLTYPPEPIKGVIVTGFMTPPDADDFIYPPSLREPLLKRGYQIGFLFGQSGKLTINQIEESIRGRTKAAKWLMESQDWDFFMVVYMASDGIVHKYPGDPQMVQHVYKILDDAIATLMAAAPDNTITLLVSDHGIGVLHKAFMLNNWLFNNGFIQFKPSHKSEHAVGKSPTRVFRKLAWLDFLSPILHKLPFNLRRWFIKQTVPELTDIDSSRSCAWSPAAIRNFAFISLGKRCNELTTENQDETLRRLHSELLRITDPKTGKRVVRAIHNTRDLIWGPSTTAAPQLIVETGEDYSIKGLFTYDRNEFRHYSHPIASHTREGIFMAIGPGITSKTKETFAPNIWDVMPTVLHILNVAPPTDLDGRVLREIYLPGSKLEQRENLEPVRIPFRQRQRHELSKEEQEKVVDRLRQLGYL